ncbi:MAG: hypothetical protein QXO22_08665, partial [Thermosphaera sp.]
MENKPTITVISQVGVSGYIPTGGVLRSIRSLTEYAKYFNVHLIIPPYYKFNSTTLQGLKINLGVNEINHLDTKLRPILNNERLSFVYPLIPSKILGLVLKGLEKREVIPNAVVVLNETLDCLRIGCLIKDRFNIPSLALIQLPIFYYDRKRLRNIKKVFDVWFGEVYEGEVLGRFVREFRNSLEIMIRHSIFVEKILQNYDVLVAVSKAVALEMGSKWRSKFHVLDPGVALDEEDLKLISEVRRKIKEKEDYIVFGGRVD